VLEIDFDKVSTAFLSADELKMHLDKNIDGFKFRKKIYRARHYSDLAHDCLEACFIGDQLCRFSERISIVYSCHVDPGFLHVDPPVLSAIRVRA
jgi:hypothetical protein